MDRAWTLVIICVIHKIQYSYSMDNGRPQRLIFQDNNFTSAFSSTHPPVTHSTPTVKHPHTLPPVTTMCAVCSGPLFLCEQLYASTPCTPPNNYCINTITNHLDGTKTVDRRCGNFDTCYKEWFLGSSDSDRCRNFDENHQEYLDFKCTYCCTTDDCNIPLHPPQNSLYLSNGPPQHLIFQDNNLTSTFPSTHPHVTHPTPTVKHPYTLPPVTTMCAVCSGPLFLCEQLYASTPCTPPNNYCINTVTNHLDGTKTVDRRCGNFDTCYKEWFLGSSDSDRCRNFDENDQYYLDFKCTYCCTTDDCNIPLHPPQNSLYLSNGRPHHLIFQDNNLTSALPSTHPPVTHPTPTVKHPYTLPPVTTMCAVCSGPLFLCEQLYASTPCTPLYQHSY